MVTMNSEEGAHPHQLGQLLNAHRDAIGGRNMIHPNAEPAAPVLDREHEPSDSLETKEVEPSVRTKLKPDHKYLSLWDGSGLHGTQHAAHFVQAVLVTSLEGHRPLSARSVGCTDHRLRRRRISIIKTQKCLDPPRAAEFLRGTRAN